LERLENLPVGPTDRFREEHSLSGLRAVQRRVNITPSSPRATRGADRDRTDDLRLAKPALSQLSYSPVLLESARASPRLQLRRSVGPVFWRLFSLGRDDRALVGQGRVELPTSRLSGVRSNHLSYWPGGLEGRPRTSAATLARPFGGLGPWKLNRTLGQRGADH
jgi:hypothetical protein